MVKTASLPTVIANLRAWIMGILAAVATLFLVVGGVRYLAAGGDPGEVERAKGSEVGPREWTPGFMPLLVAYR